ncbi:MAG TPA: thioredoxin domain-containing protein [Rhizomicrobium sp.]|nr:thioredoxin domain-containing protein [Rhizomicrobium sp.]
MTRNQLIITAVAVVIIILAAVGYYVFLPGNTSTADAIPVSGSGAQGYTLTADDHTMGSPKAPIVFIEYAAPTCPHCAHFNETVVPYLKSNYIDSGKVYYVFRVFPLHSSDGAAEAMARCLPKDQYFQFIDMLFRSQKEWDWEYGVSDVHGALVKMGRLAGLSPEKVDSCIADQATQASINKVATDGQTRYSIQGTPTFVINGVVREIDSVGTPADLDTTLKALLAKK